MAIERAAKKPRARRMRLSSVANSIRLTKAFSENEYEMGISALARRLGLAKSTVDRLATTLVEYDILEQNRETGKYRLGLALFELGTLVRRKMDTNSGAQVQIHSLAEETGETVQLAILDHLSVLYIRIRESKQAVRMSSGLGSRAPAHCTSVGKALLAYQPPEVIQQVIDNGLKRYTEHTITEGAALIEELATVRQKGYAIDDEEIEVGLRCVAAPIRDHTGQVTAAISVAAPVQRMTKKNIQATIPSVVAAAEAISRRLGYLPSLTGVRELSPDMREFTFKAKDAPGFLPGQYALFYLPGLEAPRTYSMSNIDDGSGTWQFIVRRVAGGTGTVTLFDKVAMGDAITLDGPYGLAYLRPESPRDLVLIGGGSGLAPMLSLARGPVAEPRLDGRNIHVFYGARTLLDLCGPAELEALPGYGSRITFTPVLSHHGDDSVETW